MLAVGGAAIPSRTVSDRLMALESQKREVSEARITSFSAVPTMWAFAVKPAETGTS